MMEVFAVAHGGGVPQPTLSMSHGSPGFLISGLPLFNPARNTAFLLNAHVARRRRLQIRIRSTAC
jgi:hypothetical protein